MRIATHPAALKRNSFGQWAIRFVFGGLITAVAGLIAHKYGPTIGGLFLAFPAILPASLTLVARHEGERDGTPDPEERTGRLAAGVDAAGAALGSLGLLAFGAVVWLLAARLPAWESLTGAALAWAAVSGLAWVIRQRL